MRWLLVALGLLLAAPAAAQAAEPSFAKPGTFWQATYTENGLQTKLERRSATDWRTLETRVNGDLAWSGNVATPSTLEGKVEARFQAVPPPTANFTWTPANPTGTPVQVNYTSTVTCPASPCTYAWTHPDSFGAGSPNPSFTYQVVGTKTVRLAVTDARGRTVSVTKQVVVSAAPPPPPTEMRPWVSPIVTSSTVGARGTATTLQPGTTYTNVQFLGQIIPTEGVTIRRSVFDGPHGMGEGGTLLYARDNVNFTLEFSEFEGAEGRSGMYQAAGRVVGQGNWWHDNGGGANPSQFAHGFYLGGGAGAMTGGLIERSAAWGLHIYSPLGNPDTVHDWTWDGLETRANGKAGVIFSERFSNVRLTNLKSNNNGTYGVDYHEAKPFGPQSSVAGDLSGNPLGSYEPGLGAFVDVSGVTPPLAQCADGVDNADPEDTLVDLADPGCANAQDNDETNTPPPPPGCNLNATPTNFASQVTAATAGQTVCLATGSYGTWAGTNKAITVKAAEGASPTMRISFGSGDSAFTLDGMGGMGGTIGTGAANITVKNSAFNTCMEFSGAQTNTVFDNNTHLNIDATCGNTRLGLGGSGVTVKNSLMQGGDADGAFIVADDVLFANNTVRNICDGATGNHADGLQYGDPNGWPTPGDPLQEHGSNAIVRGNFFDFKGCPNGYGQALTSFNSGTEGALIEDNVIDTTRPWGIELYADDGSTVRHNTVRWYPDAQCEFNGPECGKIDLTCCPPGQGNDSPGSGTLVYDNVGVVSIGSATAARNDHNVSGATVSYVGPLTTYSGFRLTSPKGTASDGLDVGVR